MKVAGFNHPSIGTKNLEKLVKFYETLLGMQTSYNFGFKMKYLRCGRTMRGGACCLLAPGAAASQASATG
jgi:catechol 2,3-dioxygenase-like lactoylglutathione lyase family enzyme